jgi:excisionase family DNA binding protein
MIGEEDNNVMFSVAEVATILNVHANTVRKWSDEGRIKSCRVGPRGDRGFTPDDLKKFIESSLVMPLEFYGSSVAGDGNHELTLLNIS